jgi:hypothetical protein
VHAEPITAYEPVREQVAAAFGAVRSRRGDPQATGPAILEIVDAENPPLRVFFGDGPLQIIREEYARRLALWEEWAELSVRAQGAKTERRGKTSLDVCLLTQREECRRPRGSVSLQHNVGPLLPCSTLRQAPVLAPPKHVVIAISRYAHIERLDELEPGREHDIALNLMRGKCIDHAPAQR